jgi:hypothetical protein
MDYTDICDESQPENGNCLIALTQGSDLYGFEYNGLGDRLSQTVNGVTTNYTLDLNSGLTQVLSDGHYDYLYGVTRIAQVTPYLTEYYLTDALGSAEGPRNEMKGIGKSRAAPGK